MAREELRVGWKILNIGMPAEDLESLMETAHKLALDRSTFIRIALREAVVRVQKGELLHLTQK